MFRKLCISKKEGLSEGIKKLELNGKDVDQSFLSLWTLFKNLFLSPDFMKTIFNDIRKLRINFKCSFYKCLYEAVVGNCSTYYRSYEHIKMTLIM